jgi:hypothetical protein
MTNHVLFFCTIAQIFPAGPGAPTKHWPKEHQVNFVLWLWHSFYDFPANVLRCIFLNLQITEMPMN